MKVLQLCNKPPYPPVDGGSMGINFVTQGLLGKGCKVKVLTVESDKHPAKVDASMEEYRSRTAFESVYVDLGVKFLPAMTAMRLCRTFLSVILHAACISVACLLAGITISYLYATPTGASIVLCNIAIFLVYSLIGLVRDRN